MDVSVIVSPIHDIIDHVSLDSLNILDTFPSCSVPSSSWEGYDLLP